MRAHLKRNYQANQTNGWMYVQLPDGSYQSFCTIEPPWLNNEPKKSCIPTGVYRLKKRWSSRFRWHYHVLDVPGRSYILIHPGNTVRNTTGCILIGMTFTDWNNDGVQDLKDSRIAMNKLLDIGLTELIIE